MSQFSFKDYIFTYLFPYYYQANDTYRDGTGKGILQRFIETCSEYFDTDIIADATEKTAGDTFQPGLDNLVNLIDFDKTPELFLNYLWEFLGEIPFGYGLIVQGKVYDKTDLSSWMVLRDFPEVDPRALLKYAISLYKVRGTEKFYEVLGRFYGISLELVETNNGGSPGDPDPDIPNHTHLVLATYLNDGQKTIATYSLGNERRRAPFWDGDCTSCLFFKIKVGMSTTLYNKLVSHGTLGQAISTIQSIVEKYLPIHCKTAVYANGDPKIVITTS